MKEISAEFSLKTARSDLSRQEVAAAPPRIGTPMDRKRFNLKSCIISALVAGAAALIVFSSIGYLKDPSGIYRLEKTSFAKPETLNIQLNWLQGILAPMDKYLPADAGLRYVGQEEAFDYFQAVLAPRCISPDLNSLYILVYAGPAERGALERDLQNTRLLARLSGQIELLQQENQH
jgi:hypothetical protein